MPHRTRDEEATNSARNGPAIAPLAVGRALLRAVGAPGHSAIALEGMPEVRLSHPPISLREYIPWPWIYAPVAIKWMFLSIRYGSVTLPTAANPSIEAGGLGGESKSSYLRQVGEENQRWIARWFSTTLPGSGDPAGMLQDVEVKMADAGLAFPVVAKPDIGACGYGVRLVRNADELLQYVAHFPPCQAIIVQEFVSWAGEAGIFYVRHPHDERGRIYSLGLRYYPHVVGDGRRTLRQLIEADPRASRSIDAHLSANSRRLEEVPRCGTPVRLAIAASLRVGALYRDGSAYVTPSLSDWLDGVARSMPGFYYGRFDVRFRDLAALMQARDLSILEINGAGSEAIHIWDPQLTIRDAYRSLFGQTDILFSIAAHNRARGVAPLGLRRLIALLWREARLLRRYPASN